MQLLLVLADAARTHPDGTFSLLRGGITKVTVTEGSPRLLRASLLARILFDPAEAGPHAFRVLVIDQDGSPAGIEVNGNFTAPTQGGVLQIVIDLANIFPQDGKYDIRFSVDNHLHGSWPIACETKKKKEE